MPRVSSRIIYSGSSLAGLKGEITLQTPWTTIEALMEDGYASYQGEDSSFIWVKENGAIMCDPKYILVDFETEYELTEDEVKSLEYAEGIVKDSVFYVASARIEGEYYNAD